MKTELKNLKQNELLFFLETMEMLLKSHCSLEDSLTNIENSNYSKKVTLFAAFLKLQLKEGKSFSSALQKSFFKFDPLFFSIIKVGEKTNSLYESFKAYSAFIREKKELKEEILRSCLYPCIVLVTALCVVLCMIFFVLPNMEFLFESVLGSSEQFSFQFECGKNALKNECFIFLGIIFFFIIIFFAKKNSLRFSNLFDSFILHIPFIKDFVSALEIASFSFAVKTLLNSKISFSESIEDAIKSFKNQKFKNCSKKAFDLILEGYPCDLSFAEFSVFPAIMISWLTLAENSCNAQKAFEQIYDFYSARRKKYFSLATSFSEPFFILCSGIIVFSVVIHIVLPVFRMLEVL